MAKCRQTLMSVPLMALMAGRRGLASELEGRGLICLVDSLIINVSLAEGKEGLRLCLLSPFLCLCPQLGYVGDCAG